jgi:alkylhydroperoxidase family enzyme
MSNCVRSRSSLVEDLDVNLAEAGGVGDQRVDMHSRQLRKAGESDERLFAVAAWRDTPYFTDAERAALALTEAVTRLRAPDPVPDNVWQEAARHYDETGLAALMLAIANINVWNRLNVATRQIVDPNARW